jgi:hypothetical protein
MSSKLGSDTVSMDQITENYCKIDLQFSSFPPPRVNLKISFSWQEQASRMRVLID